MMLAAAASLASCSHAPQANLKSDVDSLSYMMGIATTQGLLEFVQGQGIDSTTMANFIQGLEQGCKETDAKQKAYMVGMQIGQQVSGQMFDYSNRRIFGGDSAQSLSKENYLAGFVAAVKNQTTTSATEAGAYVESKQQEVKTKAMEAQYADYKKENEAFLASNKGKEGIQTTASGLQYKVITKGTGAIPTAESTVKVMYKGTLIDGTEFDSSKDPITFGVNRVIKGWTEALTMMPVGSKWELYIPQELAYGAQQAGKIKPFSTLIFEVEPLGIEK